MVVGNFKLKLNKNWNGKKHQKVLDTTRLKCAETAKKYQELLNEKLPLCSNDLERIQSMIHQLADSLLSPRKTAKRKPWITDEIMTLVEERNKVRKIHDDQGNYKELCRKIQCLCRKAREDWLLNKCKELEDLQAPNDTRVMHRRIKTMNGKNEHDRLNSSQMKMEIS